MKSFLLLLAAISLAAVRGAEAYTLEGPQWPANQRVPIQLHLGSSNGALADGSASWADSAEAALAQWATVLGDLAFDLVPDSAAAAPSQNDGANSVFFADSAFGTAFGPGVLAVTVYQYKVSSAGQQTFTEADVVVNSKEPFNSYAGPLHNKAGDVVYDFHRVILHEFGHLLGLGHTAQAAAAIMTPTTSDIDELQADDVSGVQALYGAPPAGAITSLPPAPVVPAPAHPIASSSAVPPLPTVSVLTVSPLADASSGVAGRITFTRDASDLSQDLAVIYNVKGNAAPGVDYAPLNGIVYIAAGSASTDVAVTPLQITGGRKVKVIVTPSASYAMGTARAKVKID